VLVGQDGIRDAVSTGLRSFRITADDAGTVTPTLGDSVEAAGGALLSVREARLTFDEVFTILVERAGDQRGNGTDSEPASTPRDAAA